MSAAALPRQTGLKWLASGLAFLCLALFLLAIENPQATGTWRALRDGAAPTAARVADRARDLPSEAAAGLRGLKTMIPPDGLPDLADAVAVGSPVAAADPAPAVLSGVFGPADDATTTVGRLAVSGATLTFDSGETLRTRPLRIAAGRDAFAAGETFAGRWRAPADAQIELREVVAGEDAAAAPGSPLCGGAAPGAVALLHRRDRLEMMVFRAPAAVGPGASPSAVCGVWSFRQE